MAQLTAGIYSTSKHSYLFSGLEIGSEISPGQYTVNTTQDTISTKITTRAGPNSLYEEVYQPLWEVYKQQEIYKQ